MIYALSQIQKLKGRTVLLDTNILLFVYGAGREDSERVRSYSRGMAALMGQGIETVVTPTILSEFYNQSLRQAAFRKPIRSSARSRPTLSRMESHSSNLALLVVTVRLPYTLSRGRTQKALQILFLPRYLVLVRLIGKCVQADSLP